MQIRRNPIYFEANVLERPTSAGQGRWSFAERVFSTSAFQTFRLLAPPGRVQSSFVECFLVLDQLRVSQRWIAPSVRPPCTKNRWPFLRAVWSNTHICPIGGLCHSNSVCGFHHHVAQLPCSAIYEFINNQTVCDAPLLPCLDHALRGSFCCVIRSSPASVCAIAIWFGKNKCFPVRTASGAYNYRLGATSIVFITTDMKSWLLQRFLSSKIRRHEQVLVNITGSCEHDANVASVVTTTL